MLWALRVCQDLVFWVFWDSFSILQFSDWVHWVYWVSYANSNAIASLHWGLSCNPLTNRKQKALRTVILLLVSNRGCIKVYIKLCICVIWNQWFYSGLWSGLYPYIYIYVYAMCVYYAAAGAFSLRKNDVPGIVMPCVCVCVCVTPPQAFSFSEEKCLVTYVAVFFSGQLWKVRLVFCFCPTRLLKRCGKLNIW
jgi:hypothetical protein